MKPFCAFLLLGAALTNSAESAVFKVTRTDDPPPNGCARYDCSLREAVLAANAWPGRDTVALLAATYNLVRIDVSGSSSPENGPLRVTESLLIDGQGLASTRVRWNSPYRFHHALFRTDHTVPDAVSLTLRDLTVSGGRGGDGGCIHMQTINAKRHHLILESTRVENCVAQQGGGAVFLMRANLSLRDAQLLDNRATRSGGALELRGGTTIDSRNSIVRGNTAGEHGGAVRIWGAGTVGVESDVVWIDDGTSVIDGNLALGDGGAFQLDSTATLDLSTNDVSPVGQLLRIENNVANGLGGGFRYGIGNGLVQIYSTNRLHRVRVLGNQASSGGGIHTSVSLQLSDVEIAGNLATASAGGGIAFAGAIEWMAGRNLQRVSMHDNAAPASGGGAISSECASFNATDISLHFNRAADGRGQALETTGPAQLRHVTLYGNDNLPALGSPGLTKRYDANCGDTRLEYANSLLADDCASMVPTLLVSNGGNQLGPGATACPRLPAADELQAGADAFLLGTDAYGGDFEVAGWMTDANARPQRDFGLAAYCSASDARRMPRADGLCDAGAFEQQ